MLLDMEGARSMKTKTKLTTIYEFDMAWVGWEGDCCAAILEDNEGKRYLTTKSYRKDSPVEDEPVKMLRDKIKEYERLIVNTEEALKLLREAGL